MLLGVALPGSPSSPAGKSYLTPVGERHGGPLSGPAVEAIGLDSTAPSALARVSQAGPAAPSRGGLAW